MLLSIDSALRAVDASIERELDNPDSALRAVDVSFDNALVKTTDVDNKFKLSFIDMALA